MVGSAPNLGERFIGGNHPGIRWIRACLFTEVFEDRRGSGRLETEVIDSLPVSGDDTARGIEMPKDSGVSARAEEVRPLDRGTERLVSLDADRGLIMILLVAHGFGFGALKDHPVWGVVAQLVDHVEWQGMVLWDLIQPAFMFMVGVAMPYSFAKRGQSFWIPSVTPSVPQRSSINDPRSAHVH